MNKSRTSFWSDEDTNFEPVSIDELRVDHLGIVIDKIESKVLDFKQFLSYKNMGIKKYPDAVYVG